MQAARPTLFVRCSTLSSMTRSTAWPAFPRSESALLGSPTASHFYQNIKL
jgi:hypothetical protein